MIFILRTKEIKNLHIIQECLQSKNERGIELVGGQQRFTAMTLLGIHFKWNDFLYVSTAPDNILRLQFTAREEDKKYILK